LHIVLAVSYASTDHYVCHTHVIPTRTQLSTPE
jgi:hypothetical protein